ncbi:hypothetical protein [Parafrankia sp. EUN1f]|uniref:hypothetical protein n=1 Tax=Parafrankia sp. EUN1f TaxID=102897 RepID=UPI001E4C9C2B|nr:hypothetical protein [Parafrankia sp. EUN1f]
MAPRSRVLVALAVAVFVGGTVIARRRGYAVGGRTIVRCRQGHLFTTVWIPGVSLKAIRLGWLRYQRCPVGHHWTFVTPVRASDLTDADRAAAAVLDTPVP